METQTRHGKNSWEISVNHWVFKDKTLEKIAKIELEDITRDPKEWNTELELLWGDLQELDAKIDDMEIMTYIIPNLPQACKIIEKKLEEKLDDEDYPITIKNICGKFLVKYNLMNVWTETKKEEEKSLCEKIQYKGTCTSCHKYRNKAQYLRYKDGSNK